MLLLEQILRPSKAVHIRRPDYVETQNGYVLQIWGEEGYWHIVDEEFSDLLKAVEQPQALRDLFLQHPNWRAHKRSILAQLATMKESGLGYGRRATPAPSTIENVTLNLTTACNLHCHTCYVPDELRNGIKLDVDRVLHFLEDLRPCMSRQATVSLLGGEPFLHPEGLLGVGRWAKKHRFSCNVSTNGTIISRNLQSILRDNKIKVQVSLDGATARTNDGIRGANTFDRATATVKTLVKHAIPTTLCMVCCQENLSEIPDYFRLAHELKVQEVRFIPLKKLGNSRTGFITPAAQLDVVSAICKELDADSSLAAMCRTDIYSIMKSMLRESSRHRTCGTGTQTLLVQADGTVYPCINTTIPTLALGDISNGRAPILSKGRAFGEQLSIDSLTHPCHDCMVKRWCLAVCPGETLHHEGRLSRRHWNCTDVKNTIIYVMWRLAQEKQNSKKPIAGVFYENYRI